MTVAHAMHALGEDVHLKSLWLPSAWGMALTPTYDPGFMSANAALVTATTNGCRMARPCRDATPKVEEWRSIDLADSLEDARSDKGSEEWEDPGDHL